MVDSWCFEPKHNRNGSTTHQCHMAASFTDHTPTSISQLLNKLVT